MIRLIIGGSGSGKSVFAENCLSELKDVQAKYYVATMMVSEEEGRKKVERHRKQRAGKGFRTVEQAVDIERAAEEIREENAAVLLECMSNLVANEMFREGDYAGNEMSAEGNYKVKEMSNKEYQKTDIVVKKIVGGVWELQAKVKHIVIVTNNVFEDGIRYDDATTAYMQALSAVNRALAEMADEVTEVVVGIPITLKKERGALWEF